jgi:hypothetical protein
LNQELTEHAIQSQIIQYLKFNHIFCFSVPNGIFFNSNSKKGGYSYINKLKAAGFLKGVSDIIILLKNRAIFVECKRLNEKISKQTKEQKEFELEVKSLGFEYYIWRDVADSELFVKGLK